MKPVTVFIPLLMCCLTEGCDRFAFVDREAELDNVFEAIVRYNVFGYGPQRDREVFLTLNGKQPSPEFLKRFDQKKYRFVNSIVDDGKTWIYSLGDVNWISNNELEVNVRYHCGLECGGSYTLLLIRKNKSWSVDKKYNEVVE